MTHEQKTALYNLGLRLADEGKFSAADFAVASRAVLRAFEREPPLSAPEQALADANPSTYPEEIRTASLLQSIDRLKAKLREVPSVAAAMDEREDRATGCAVCGAPLPLNGLETVCEQCRREHARGFAEPDHESVPDRSERLAARYTREDGRGR